MAATPDNLAVAAAHDVLVIGTEPEDVPHVLRELGPLLDPRPCPSQGRGPDASKLLISIAAGVRTERMLELVPEGVRVVRVMPNTPCVVGEIGRGPGAVIHSRPRLSSIHIGNPIDRVYGIAR